MALLRSIGNRFRRPDDRSEYDATITSTASGMTDQPSTQHSFIPSGLSSKILGTGVGGGGPDSLNEESPDLYYEDRPLGTSIHALEEIRLALRELATATNEHKDMLVACANTERSLGDTLADVMENHSTSDGEDKDRFSDIQLTNQSRQENRKDENSPNEHFSSYLPIEFREAQKALGRGLAHHSDATIKLSVAISTPINDLIRSFEERYTRKIVPLRRRYLDQKGQYLKYKRNVDMAESDEKRSYYEALAEAAKPVWMRTSTELRTESDVMTELTAKNMAKWSRALTLQHERALAIAAANFADAFNRAKSLPPFSRGTPK